MGTFQRKDLFKTVRMVEIQGKLEFIDSNERTQPILDQLEKEGLAVDIGFKIKFVPPKCPICGKTVQRGTISDPEDKVIQIVLICPSCWWLEEMPK